MNDPHHPATRTFRLVGVLVMTALGSCASGAAPPGSSADHRFMHDSDVAMTTMMTAMQIRPSGDVDRDFATMMIPHHQGAIDMAVAELRDGRDEQLRRIAQEIVADQTQEITVMRLALGERSPAPPTRPSQGTTMPAGMNAMRGAR